MFRIVGPRWVPAAAAAVALMASGLMYRAVAPPLRRDTGELSIVYPFNGALFPPEIIAPTVWWKDTHRTANRWRISVGFDNDTGGVGIEVDTLAWTPRRELWEYIKRRSIGRPATITVTGVRRVLGWRVTLSSDSVTVATSPDSVGAPIFYRDVPLPFRFALRNVPMIRWRLGNIASEEPPPTVLTNLPVCGNCHSFSLDGKYLGMDVDIGNDKGAYVLTPFEPRTLLSRDKLISWSDYVRDEKVPTFGMLPRVSPDGRYVLAGVKDRAVFLPREDLLFSQIFFPVMGILAYYDRLTGRIEALRGADDEDYVQTNGVWTPDGREVIFARSGAVRLKTQNPTKDILLNTDESAEVLGGKQFLHVAQEGGKRFRFDLYRLPFNAGRGGSPEPIEGASRNGMSNFFPKVSPNGRWLVFTQAHSFMLLQPDSKLYIMPVSGGAPRLMTANTSRMNSWHSWSPNSRWLVFSSKVFGPYTQLFLTHIDDDGNDTPPVLLRNFTAPDRAANIPEFVNVSPSASHVIEEHFIDDYNYFRSGRIYQQFREYDRAEQEFLKSLQMNPKNTFSLYSLATMYAENEDYERAITALRRILDIDPGAAVVHKDLGSAYFQIGEFQRAEAEFLEAVRLDGGNVAARFNLATAYLRRGALDPAEQQLQRVLSLDVDSGTAVRVRGKLAAIYMRQGRYRQAVGQLEAVLAADSENVDARFDLALSYRAMNELARARQELEAIVRHRPNDAEAHNRLGEVYAALQAYPAAREHFQKATELDPDNLVGLLNLGRLCYEIGDYEWAERALEEAVTIAPDNVYAHVSLGMVYHETARYERAVTHFRFVVERRPTDAKAWFMLGEALIKEGRSTSDAIGAFEEGLRLDPSYIEGHLSLGDLHVRAGDSLSAIRSFESALSLRPSDPKVVSELTARLADLRKRP